MTPGTGLAQHRCLSGAIVRILQLRVIAEKTGPAGRALLDVAIHCADPVDANVRIDDLRPR